MQGLDTPRTLNVAIKSVEMEKDVEGVKLKYKVKSNSFSLNASKAGSFDVPLVFTDYKNNSRKINFKVNISANPFLNLFKKQS